ncbi:MAG: hypothetical protein JWL77_1429 [Chthonomonadaceae bacterium]|nr:hypothetical protein [Chthonomonadaceae bacterium]
MERLELSNSLPHTTTWVYIGEDGRLTIEWYDYSEEADRWMGGDVAFLLYVGYAGKQQMWSLLGDTASPPEDRRDDMLLQLLHRRFGSYHEVKSWLTDNNVPFEAEFDGNA